MTNYYELLHIDPSASQADIQTAIDEQYQKYNQLVTHHQPEVALKASQAKQLLQRIRETLLNKEKRKAYDEGLGLGDNIGALMDPDAIIQTFSRPLSPPKHSSGQESVGTIIRTDAWVCPSCANPNPIDTLFCEKCGIRIALPCPQCNKLSELSKTFCRACGADKEKVFKSQKESFIQTLVEKQQALLERKRKIEHDEYTNEPVLENIIAHQEGKLTVGLALCILGVFLSILFITIKAYFPLCIAGTMVIMGVTIILSNRNKPEVHGEKQEIITELFSQHQQYDTRIEKIRQVSYKDSQDISYEQM